MSFKHLFEKAQTLKSLSNQSADQVGSAIESAQYQKQDIIKERRFIPAVDYTTASNFARYGSAEKYYGESLDRIYKTYPYDGSLKERLEWENESTEIDLYLYDNLYPRRTGYVLMSPAGWGTRDGSEANGYGLPNTLEYIYFKGGPNPNSDGMSPLYLQFTGSNYYDTGSNRTSNLKYDLSDDGVTLEFWMKKDAFASSLTTKEVVFDMWNGEAEGLDHYGRLSLAVNSANEGGSVFTATLLSGSDGVSETSIGSSVTIADSTWHHYAFSFKNASAGITSRVYIDGALNQESTLGSDALNEITGALQATIGALGTTLDGGAQYAGKLSGSLDEFRYWKTQRSSRDIGRFWFTQVGGGVNTDPMPFKDTSELANTNLGIYYKFNEGITGTSSIDSTVLDYSGRVSNGAWTGYTSDSRNTGSAIISSSAAIKEFEDPIIYSFDPAVVALRAQLIQSGSDHDASNAASIYSSIPAWITEEDTERGGQLHNLTQIMASYLDTLHLQIESLNKLKDISYISGSDKASVFAERMLMSTGLITPELFVDASVLEKLGDRSESLVFDKNLSEIKNLIYKNIYNNLTYIYKSKGTEKAFRNLIRCFGVDDELIKINMYANNVEFDFTTNRTNQSYGKKYVNFNSFRSADANVYQYRDPGDTTNTTGFISSSDNLLDGYAFTMEASVMFPEKFDQSHDFYQDTNIISSSLFGVHATIQDLAEDEDEDSQAETDTLFPTDDATNFQVYAVREIKDSSNVVFILKSSAGGHMPTLTSSMFYDVYNNNNWNFAVKVSPSNYPWVGHVEHTPVGDYDIEFQGVNVEAGVIVNSFNVTGTATAPGAAFITGSRRAYVGAHRTNMTGTLLESTDVKIGSVRLWLDKLSTQTVEAHAYDPTNYGLADTGLYAFPFQASASYGDLPRINTLLLNWNFNQNTGSDADGSFRVADISSGSATMAATQNDWLGNILYYQHPGSGSNFSASTSTVVDKDYVVASKQNLPESLQSSDMITVLSQQDDVEFTRDSRPQNYFLAFEKSMQQAISDQMINYFASLTDLNTLIGAPVNRYRSEYKGLKFLKQRFFESVSNDEVDFEKFFEYYKWIDGTLSVLLGQLAPVSLDFDPNVRTLIESHILERSKYQNKFPFLAKSEPDLSGTIGTIAMPITVNSIINDAQGTGIESAQAPTNRVTGMPNTSVLNSWKYDHAPLFSPTLYTAKSMLFDGVDEYLAQGDADTWEGLIGGSGGDAKAFSVSMWVRPTTAFVNQRILWEAGNADANGRVIKYYGTAGILAASYGTTFNVRTTGVALSLGTWQHIVVTFGGGETTTPKIYVDASLEASTGASGGSPGTITTFGVGIGGGGDGTSPSEGYMCDVAVWDKELSSDEVTEIYGSDLRVNLKNTSVYTNLLSWWLLGGDPRDTSDGTIYDVASGRNATPTNFDSSDDITTESPALEGRFNSGFIGGQPSPSLGSKSVWWQNRAGRDIPSFNTPEDVDADREVLLKAIQASNNRTLGRPYRFSGGGSVVLGGVARHPSQRKGVVYEATAPAGPTVGQGTYGAVPSDIMVAKSADVESLMSSSDVYFPSQKVRYGFGMGVQSASYEAYERDSDGATVAPFSLYSSSISDAISSEMSNFTGSTIITNMHADLTSDQTDVPMQGPFTEKFVGGRQHRHIELNQSGSPDSISDPLTMANNFNGLDTRVNRPEGFRVQMGYEYVGAQAGSDPWNASSGHLQVVSPQYPELDTDGETTNLYDRPKANLPRGEYAKRPVNIKNILMTTASLSQSMSGVIDHNRIGNYTKNYEVIQTAGRSQNDPYFQKQTFAFAPNPETMATRGRFPMLSGAVPSASSPYATASNRGPNVSGTLDYELPARTGSASNQTILVNRFNAPGSPEASSQGYLDPAHEEFSVYNALPYRNQTVVNYGLSGSASLAPSGSNSIIPQDQLDLPRGLNQLSTLHCGPFGADAAFGEITLAAAEAGGDGTVVSASFHKTQRNTRRRLEYIQETRSLLFNGTSTDYQCNGGISTEDDSWNDLIGGIGTAALPFTFSFWVNLNSVSSDQTIIYLSEERGVYLENTGDYMQFFIGKDSGGNDGIVRTSALTANRWYHIVTTFAGGDPEGADTEDYMKIYVNGAEDTTVVSELDDPEEIKGDSDGFRFGVDSDGDYLDGYLSNVAVWKTELSAAEANTIYNAGRLFDLTRVKVDDFLAWYRMSDQGGLEPPDTTEIIQNRAPKAADYFGTVDKTNFTAATAGTYASTVPASPPTWPIVTGSVYDNLYEQHGVPNADRNYAWITASLDEGVPFFGFDQQIPAPGQTDTPWYIGNKSIPFDGAYQFMDIAGDPQRVVEEWNSLIGGAGEEAKAFSISTWIYPTNNGSQDSIWMVGQKAASGADPARKIHNASNKPYLVISNSGLFAGPTTQLTTGVWTHVVWTFAGGGPTGTDESFAVYYNGVSQALSAVSSTPASDITLTTPTCRSGMRLGGSIDTSTAIRASNLLTGSMADFAIWGKELTAHEANRIYNEGYRYNLKNREAPPKLLAWWPLGSDPDDTSWLQHPLLLTVTNTGSAFDEVSRREVIGKTNNSKDGQIISTTLAPSGSLPLYGLYKNTAPKVSEISAYIEPGLQSPSGTIVPGMYPFQGRASGAYSAPDADATSMNQLYEPPYSTLVESASVNIAGFAYNDYSIRYANLDTHTLEPPNFQPNRYSLRISGSGYGEYDGSGQGPNFICGTTADWANYGAPIAYSASSTGRGNSVGPNSAWTTAVWLKIIYSGSFINAAGATGNCPGDGGGGATGDPFPGTNVIPSDSRAGKGSVLTWPWQSPAVASFTPEMGIRVWPRFSGMAGLTNSSSLSTAWVPELFISGGYNDPVSDARGEEGQNAEGPNYASMWITASNWDIVDGTGGPLELDTWYHLVCTYDGTDPSCMHNDGTPKGYTRDYSAIKMYLNGVSMIENGQVTSGALFNSTSGASGLTAPAPVGQGPILLGNLGFDNFGYPFPGLLNEVQIYDKVLSATEIGELYQRRGTNLFGWGAKQNLTNWYRMGNDGSRATAVFIEDVIGGANAINVGLTGSAYIASASSIVSEYLSVWAHPVTAAWGYYYASGSNEYRYISGSRLSDSFVTFNHAMLNLNGPYQNPSWKQTRTGEHPVARRLRETNTISVASPPPMVPSFVLGGTNPINMLRGKSSVAFTDYIEQPLDTRYKPFIAAFEDSSESPNRENNVSVQVSYGNNLGYFSNAGLNNKLNLRPNLRQDQAYTEVQDYIDRSGETNISVYASYGERVFPRSVNAYQKRVRTRQNYTIENIWDKNRVQRVATVLNSQGYPDYSVPNTPATGAVVGVLGNAFLLQGLGGVTKLAPGGMDNSPWPLDAPQKYTIVTSSAGASSGSYNAAGAAISNTASLSQLVSGGLSAIVTGAVPWALFSGENQLGVEVRSLFENLILAGTGAGSGELQNTYNYFAPSAHGGYDQQISNSCRPACCYLRPLPETPARIQGGYPDLAAQLVPANNTLMGFHPWVAHLQENIDPYQPYQDYAENLRLAGKDCSIVPEFRISELLEEYLGNPDTVPSADGFLTKLPNLIDLTGSSLDSTAKDFYSVYATTDFLELFRMVDNDLRGPRGTSEEDNIVRHGTTLQATAFTSFLPYKGFYPAERTVKLASYFSQSMGSFLPGTRSSPDTSDRRGGTSWPASSPNDTLSRILLEPLFAPGILFNTIKSGIAVGNYIIRNTASNPGDLGRTEYGGSYQFKNLGPLGIAAKRPGSWLCGAASLSASGWTAGQPVLHWGTVEGYSEFNFNSSASYQSSSINSASFGCLNVGHSSTAGIMSFMPVQWRQGALDEYNTIATGITGSRFGYYLQKIPFEAIRRPQDYLSAKALASGSEVVSGPRWSAGVLVNTASSAEAEPEAGLGAGWLYDTGVTLSSSIAASVRDSTAGTPYPASGSAGHPSGYGVLKNQTQNKIRWNGNMINPIYELAIDNFLCETVNFFQDGLTSFVSKEETAFKPVKKNKYYGMRVFLDRSKDDVGNPTFGMYSRASAYGTPLALSGSRGSGITFAHLTPPYYNGLAYADIVFQAPYSDRPTLQDIVSTANVIYSRRIENNLQLVSSTNFSASCIGYVTGSDLKTDHDYIQMQLSASVNIFDKILAIPAGTNQQKVQWLIQTKFETPMFDFYDTPTLPHPTSSIYGGGAAAPINVTSSTAPFQIRGMWHQYGRIPEPDKGVFLGIEDLPHEYHSAHHGEIEVESLRDIVGFQNAGSKKIGNLSTAKVVREAVVVVPFRQVRGERQFINMPNLSIWERSSELAERRQRMIEAGRRPNIENFWLEYLNRYNRQVNILNRYILPPNFDFLVNRGRRPVFFDAFEFTETFSKKDLQNIWQNLPPESSQKMRKQSSTINISNFFTDRIFGREDIQWLVFKVKQRATKDYDILSKRGLTKDIPIVPASIDSPYSFNWPYDYFSLVELLKIDENIEYVSQGAGASPWEDDPPPPAVGASPGSDTTGQSQFVGDYTDAEATAVLNDLSNNQND